MHGVVKPKWYKQCPSVYSAVGRSLVRPTTGGIVSTLNTEHTKISDAFLEQARHEYRAGDLLQASEKAWGAVAHYVLARSKNKGWPCGSHKLILQNIRQLGDDSPYFDRLINSVNALHANFYQDFQDHRSVLRGIEDAVELLNVLKRREGDEQYHPVPADDSAHEGRHQ